MAAKEIKLVDVPASGHGESAKAAQMESLLTENSVNSVQVSGAAGNSDTPDIVGADKQFASINEAFTAAGAFSLLLGVLIAGFFVVRRLEYAGIEGSTGAAASLGGSSFGSGSGGDSGSGSGSGSGTGTGDGD